MTKEQFTHQLVVRVPRELHLAVLKDSEDNGRNVAQTVRFHLSRALGLRS